MMFDLVAPGVYILVSRSFDSNIGYLESGDRKVLIDAGTGVYYTQLDEALSKLGASLNSITDVLLTHSHVDHIGGIVPLLEMGSPKIHLHKEEADMINSGDMSLTLGDTFGTDIPPMKIEGVLQEGDILEIGDLRIKVLHTPGHSGGSSCFHLEEESVVYTGDTMFSGGSFGRVDFPTGDPAKIVASLKRLSELENFSVALPGHMGPVRGNATRSAMSSYQMAKNWFNVS
ncbi:MAG: MBL fold metallo-hydrolase [Candidatus Thorarchaeota archaeon]|jgi:glyoxylase-like metal-dependent hydrolase (beta-lactamase superfamily II)